jgi:type IV pilus assembly protein PilM
VVRRASRSGAYLGVDIGSALIKAVELAGPAGGELTVRAAGSIATPPGTVQEGRIADPQAVGRALKELLGKSGVRARQAIASVNGQVAIVREVRMPSLPPEEVRQAARFEVERYLPYPIAEVTYDTFVTGEVKDEGNARIDVLVVAARTDILNQHVEALRAAGLEPVILDVEPFALARAMASAGGRSPEHAVVYVHIGAENTGIIIVAEDLPRVIRSVAFGGNTITKLLAQRLGLEPARAEALKLQMGAGEPQSGAGPDAIQLQEVVMASLGDLTTEVRRSLDYYGGRFRGAVPERAVVTGGSALLPGLARYLSTDLDMPVEVGDPFLGLKGTPGRRGASDGDGVGPAMAVAVGLARRGVDEP